MGEPDKETGRQGDTEWGRQRGACRAILVQLLDHSLPSLNRPYAMSLLTRLERKLGRYTVPNLTVILIVGQVLLYMLHEFNQAQGGGDILERVRLFPAAVMDGEFWRIVTFVFVPPLTNILFAFFYWYLFYLFGTTLEVTWSVFRYNVFLAIGYFASIITAFAFYFALGANAPATNAFLYGTVFLAFARLNPDFVLHLFFILPVKIKWLAMIQWFFYGFGFVFGPWMVRAMIAASLLNYFLFFGRDIWRDMRHGHRRMRHQARTRQATRRMVHQCRVCGLTSDESPQTAFRYCSRCDGEACYCPAHLQDHEHVVKETSPP